MVLTRAGLSVIRYIVGGKVTSHLLRQGGRTACGVAANGKRWKAGQRFDPSNDCKRCARVARRRGLTVLMSFCPKCASDLGAKLALRPDRQCATCGNVWT